LPIRRRLTVLWLSRKLKIDGVNSND
jgi:hypothetical protein